MKISFVISSLKPGGAEKVFALVVNFFSERGYKTTVFTWDQGEKSPFYEINSKATLVHLDILSEPKGLLLKLTTFFKRLRILRKRIIESQPSIVIPFMDRTNASVLLALFGSGIPVVVSEQNDPRFFPTEVIWRWLVKLSYFLSTQIVVQTEQIKAYYPRPLLKKLTVIPSPVLPPQCSSISTVSSKKILLSIARLDFQKGLDVFLKAFGLVHKKFPEWELVVLGEGPQRAELEQLRKKMDLVGKVHFPGRVSNPEFYLNQAQIFVLPSYFEGFPNALCEAMAHGLPAVATNCSGSSDIVRDKIDGLLVPVGDRNALAQALGRLMSDEAERKRLGKKAEEIVQRFSYEKVMRLWEEVVGKVGGDPVLSSNS